MRVYIPPLVHVKFNISERDTLAIMIHPTNRPIPVWGPGVRARISLSLSLDQPPPDLSLRGISPNLCALSSGLT